MSSVTIRYPVSTTNIKVENINNLTYLTLSNPYSNQIEIVRPVINPVQSPLRLIPASPLRLSPTSPLIPQPYISPSGVGISPVPVRSYPPGYIPSPRLVQTPQGPVSLPSSVNPSLNILPYENAPIVPILESDKLSCMGQEDTLIVKIRGLVNVDDIIKNIEAYVHVKCTEVRIGMGAKLLIIFFNDRTSLDFAYEVLNSTYQGSLDMEIYK